MNKKEIKERYKKGQIKSKQDIKNKGNVQQRKEKGQVKQKAPRIKTN